MPLHAPTEPLSTKAIDLAASAYARQLLGDLGINPSQAMDTRPGSGPDRWQASGLAELTGFPDSAGTAFPVPIASMADGVLEALRQIAGCEILPEYGGAELLTLRATLSGLSRRGAISAGGSCRILSCADGHIAVNLPRESDWPLLDAWLQRGPCENWATVEQRVRDISGSTLIERGRLLGLAVVDAAALPMHTDKWFERSHEGTRGPTPDRPARVIDLSSLWAGPLCGLLLQQAGCEVIKVESSQRPDNAGGGTDDGAKAFFNFLNDGKQQRVLELHTQEGRDQLLDIIRGADLVIEGSRPRALRQMGIHAEQLLEEVPGLTWVSITGYGREEPEANWIAYGDDAGVAAGLSAVLHQSSGRWMFCGDAIADPLTGMHAALAALAHWHAGGGCLLSVPLVETVRHCLGFAHKHSDIQEQGSNT